MKSKDSKRRGDKELRDIAIKLAHSLARCEGWKKRYEAIERTMIQEKLKTIYECAELFKKYKEQSKDRGEIYAYDHCELYCLILAEELRGGLK